MMLRKALTLCRKHLLLLSLAVILDIFFLIAFGMIYAYLFSQTADAIEALNNILSDQTAQFVATQQPTALALTAEATAYYHAVLWGIAEILLSLYVLWSLTQGINWWLAHREEGDRVGIVSVLLRIFRMNLLWLCGFILCLFGTAWLAQQSSLSPLPLFGPVAYEAVAFTLVAVVLYFTVVSYAFVTHDAPLRTSLRAAVGRARTFVPIFLIATAGMGVLGWCVVILGRTYYLAGLLIVILLLAWIALCRVWLSVQAHAVRR